MERELEVALAAAQAAGEAILAVRASAAWTAREKADGKGPVTEADLASNAVLERILRGAFPDDGWLSEETLDDPARLAKSRVWIVDPLDGTKEFTEGLPEWCVSIGLAVDGEAVLGALVNPMAGQWIVGAKGRGVYRDGVQVRTTPHADLTGARFVVSRTEAKKGGFDAWKDRISLVPMGSVAWKIAMVAAGDAEATFTPNPRNEWDLAGGVAVLAAAGGRATDGSGAPYRFNAPDPLKIGVCCTNGALHDEVLGLMRAQG